MPDQPDRTADASSLFDTDEIRPVRPKGEAGPVDDAGGYDLELDPYAFPEPPPRIDPTPLPMTGQKARKPRPTPEPGLLPDVATAPEPVPRRSKPKPAEPRESTGDTSEFETEISRVDPAWTRWGEWGPDVIRISAVGVGTMILAWLMSGWSISLSLLVLMLGGAGMVLLSYPILVTLERPVRITPEQAVTDFFAAASHHFPHYRRMWLLLSDLGRESGRFRDFDAFRDRWRSQVEGWRRSGAAGAHGPLKFDVVGFRADKSTGKSTSKAEYIVNVQVRGRDGAAPIASFKMAHGLVKGPDRMWYLNQGTPGPSQS